jgi:hypothetical protein
MPRGGRRPSAGAPKGNINAWRTGRQSHRLSDVYIEIMRLWRTGEHDTLRELFHAAFEANIFQRSSDINPRIVARIVRFWHPMLFAPGAFDRPTGSAIKRNQTQSIAARIPPPAESESTPEPAENTADALIAKIQ